MNKQRRAEATSIREEVEAIKNSLIELKERLEAVLEEEQEAYDNIPDNLQFTERYEKAGEAVWALEEAVDAFDNATSELDTVLNNIENAVD